MEGTAISTVNNNGIILLTETFFSLTRGCLAYSLTYGTSWGSIFSSVTLDFFTSLTTETSSSIVQNTYLTLPCNTTSMLL